MELRALRHFLAIVREGTISGAAQSLHLSQPTLSRQVKELEHELGATLFTRGGGQRIALTEAGAQLRKRAEQLVDLADLAEAELRSLGNELSGDVRIAAGETPAVKRLAEAAQLLRERHPRMRIHLVSGDAQDVIERLDMGHVDFCLFVGTVSLEKYETLPLPGADEWGALMPVDDPLARRAFVTPDDLRDKPLIVSRQIADEAAAWLGCRPEQLNVVATYNLLYNASVMARQGLGYAIGLGGIVAADDASGLSFKPLRPSRESRLVLAWKRHQPLSPAAAAFRDTARELWEASP
ncbi:LysR family transcriptional regulator [Gordonibacter sp. An230]|uniref:LysR family transcriptional regulator n=1 Tax=Gordonibacter sp. An230 TaxID=1965592 RepID=UPI000B36AAE0|nr:LysR family transcriptional regulator [Gordonibacter sp. An230]OUO90913.1 LysR family transcriptional regulator [Gordonibacter sp. An230]